MRLGTAAIIATLTASAAFADAPNQITYQGRLQENGGLVNGTRNIVIDLCSDSGGTTCFNAFTNGAVSVNNGIFKAVLAPPTSVNLQTGTWWLKITVAGNVLSPLEALTSDFYAQVASSVAASGVKPGVIGNGVHFGGSVGLGTTSPGGKLHVSSGSFIVDGPGGNVLLGINGTGLAVLPGGYVGIGRTDPGAMLHVFSNSANAARILLESSGSNGNPELIVRANTPAGIATLTASRADTGASSQFTLATAMTQNWNIQTPPDATNRLDFLNGSASKVMSLTQGGSLGIGTTSPGGRLHVSSGTLTVDGTGGHVALGINGTALYAAAGGFVGVGTTAPTRKVHVQDGNPELLVEGTNSGLDTYVRVKSGSSLGKISINDSNNGMYIGSETGNFLVLHTASSERVRLDNSGNLGIGVTNPQSRLHVNGVITQNTTTCTNACVMSGAVPIIFADAAGGAFNVTLPAASAATVGATYRVIKVDGSGNAVSIITQGGDSILGSATTNSTGVTLWITGYNSTTWIVR